MTGCVFSSKIPGIHSWGFIHFNGLKNDKFGSKSNWLVVEKKTFGKICSKVKLDDFPKKKKGSI